MSSAPLPPISYGYQNASSSKKIDIPNGRVGVIIRKGGETIKYLQIQSGAKIQVTRDMDANPNSPTRMVELMGTPEQIATDKFVMKIPNNKVIPLHLPLVIHRLKGHYRLMGPASKLRLLNNWSMKSSVRYIG
nr:far upstream element-binding protein 1-like [Quercus suber]